MQGDLISRKALIETFKDKISRNTHNSILRIFLLEAIKIVEAQPTAYDVEKVVAELEGKALETLNITKAQFQMDKNEYKGYCSLSLHEVENAIRNGGKE